MAAIIAYLVGRRHYTLSNREWTMMSHLWYIVSKWHWNTISTPARPLLGNAWIQQIPELYPQWNRLRIPVHCSLWGNYRTISWGISGYSILSKLPGNCILVDVEPMNFSGQILRHVNILGPLVSSVLVQGIFWDFIIDDKIGWIEFPEHLYELRNRDSWECQNLKSDLSLSTFIAL